MCVKAKGSPRGRTNITQHIYLLGHATAGGASRKKRRTQDQLGCFESLVNASRSVGGGAIMRGRASKTGPGRAGPCQAGQGRARPSRAGPPPVAIINHAAGCGWLAGWLILITQIPGPSVVD